MIFSNAPKDTLAYWLQGRALGAHLDRSKASVVSTAAACSKTGWFGTTLSPNDTAARFYLLNHAVSEIRSMYDPMEPLPTDHLDLVRRYVEEGEATAARLYYYITLISSREARHNHSSWSSVKSKILAEMEKAYPDVSETMAGDMFQFLNGFADSSSSALNQLSGVSKAFPLGPYVKMMQLMYYKCSWGAAFGGKKWGNIADCLYRFVTGEWSAEMFADTAFTLAHNTAPIFNKGMLYTTPSSGFIELLDIQRGGFIPTWLEQKGYQKSVVSLVKKSLPQLFDVEIDWAKVQADGQGTYATQVAQQQTSKVSAKSNGVKYWVDPKLTAFGLKERVAA